MSEIIIKGNQSESNIREYVLVRYRYRKPGVKPDPYDLGPRRRRVMHGSKLHEFQRKLGKGGHTLLGVSRITKAEYLALKEEIKQKKKAREEAQAALKEVAATYKNKEKRPD